MGDSPFYEEVEADIIDECMYRLGVVSTMNLKSIIRGRSRSRGSDGKTFLSDLRGEANAS